MIGSRVCTSTYPFHCAASFSNVIKSKFKTSANLNLQIATFKNTNLLLLKITLQMYKFTEKKSYLQDFEFRLQIFIKLQRLLNIE